jgi:hypothetical protein
MSKTSLQYLEHARETLCLAMEAADAERRKAIEEHIGGHLNLPAKQAENLMEVASTVHTKLDRMIEQL